MSGRTAKAERAAAEEAQRARLAAEALQPYRIDALHVWLAYDPKAPEGEDREGIVTIDTPHGPMPAVTSTLATAERMRGALDRQLWGTGKAARLVTFTRTPGTPSVDAGDWQ